MKRAEIPPRNKEMGRRWSLGESAEALAEEFGLSPSTVVWHMRRQGYRRPDWRAARRLEIVRLLREGWTYKQIADELGLSTDCVYRSVPAVGQTRRPRYANRVTRGLSAVWKKRLSSPEWLQARLRSGWTCVELARRAGVPGWQLLRLAQDYGIEVRWNHLTEPERLRITGDQLRYLQRKLGKLPDQQSVRRFVGGRRCRRLRGVRYHVVNTGGWTYWLKVLEGAGGCDET